jgi:hypothetical protein
MNPKYFLGAFVFLAGFGSFVLVADEPASTRLATRAYTVLKDHCAKCHHADEREGNKAYDVLDWNSLTRTTPSSRSLKRFKPAKAYVAPGKPEESIVWLQITKGRMPPEDEPRVSKDAKSSIKKWIEVGSPRGGFGSDKGGS